MSQSDRRNLRAERAWVLIPLTILCIALYLPFGLVVGIGSTIYAHMQRRTVVRNILLVLLTVPILILRILQP